MHVHEVKFVCLNDRTKLSELESCATDKEKADERARESERKLRWLEEIKTKVESILEV